MKSNSEFEGIIFKGVGSDYNWKNLESFLVDGNFPKFIDITSNQIIISQVIADRLSVGVGDELKAYFQNSKSQSIPNFRRFVIKGIFSSGFSDFDNNFIIGDIRHIQMLNKWKSNEIGAYEVFVSDIKLLESIGNSLYAKLPSDIDTIEISRQFPAIFKWISLFDFNILIIIIIMVIVGVINMSTALLVLVLERTQMIGLFKTIGADNKLLQKIFLYNGIFILGHGLFWGNLIGLLFYFSQKYFGWVRLDPATYFVNIAPVMIDFLDLIYINIGVLVVSILLLFIPLLIINSINPAKILRYH